MLGSDYQEVIREFRGFPRSRRLRKGPWRKCISFRMLSASSDRFQVIVNVVL